MIPGARRRRAGAGRMLAAWLLALASAWAPGSFAHEVRPAYLAIDARPDGSAQVLWRQPTAGEYALSLRPVLSGGALDAPPSREWLALDSRTRVWDLPPGHAVLAGQRLRVEGLEHSLTDVLVRLRSASGTEDTLLLRPLSPEVQLPEPGATGRVVPAYIRVGAFHIVSGADHLLYLAGLLLLVKGWRRLLATITAFTAAHSLTLAASSLGWVRLDAPLVEALIALSILYVAVELARRGRATAPGMPPAQRATAQPWVIAFAFGLLHGFGFAGALQDVGLPRDALVPALLSFNLGIEAGQVVFAVVVLAGLAGLARALPAAHSAALRIAPHAIGGLAAFWLLQRVQAFGGA